MKKFITYLSVLILTFCLIPGCTYAVGVGHSGVSGTATTIPGYFNVKGIFTVGDELSGNIPDPSANLVINSSASNAIQFLTAGTTSKLLFGGATGSASDGQITYKPGSHQFLLTSNSTVNIIVGYAGITTDTTLSFMGYGTINTDGNYISGVNNQSFRAHIFAAGTADFYPTGWGVISHTGTGAYNITLQSGFALYDASTAQAITCTASSPNVGALPTYAAVTAPYHSATNIVYINTYYNGAAYDLGADITCFAN